MDRERGSLCPSGSHPRAGVPTGVGPAPIVGVGLRCARRVIALSSAALGLAAVVALPAGASTAPSSPAAPSSIASATTASSSSVPAPTQAASASGPSPLVLISQSATVLPNQPFDVRFRVRPGSPPPAELGVSVAVYGCLSSVSAFDQSISSATPPGTPISSTRAPLPLSALTPISTGGYDLSMPVNRATSTATSTGFTIALTSGQAQCGDSPSGVYPVRIQLVDTTNGQVVGGITTHLVYADVAANTVKLQVALVLPIETTLMPSRSPTTSQLLAHPTAAVEPPSEAAIAAVTGTVAAVTAHSTVPVTLEASPQTVMALDSSPATSPTVGALASLAATGSGHQFASAPFAPVNATSLVSGGLSGELATQVTRGSQVLASTIDRSNAGTASAWFTNDTLDTATLGQLEANGYRQVVLPAGDVETSPTNGSAAEPFQLASSASSPITAFTSNADLASRFSGSPTNPALAAYQLAAELAQIYYEKPNDTAPRAVVALPPNGWSDSPEFVNALLSALDASPVVQPVTTKDLFNAFPTPSSCRGSCKLTAGTGGSDLPVEAVRLQRQRIAGFTTAAPSGTGRGVASQLGDLVLSGESERLRSNQQSSVLRNTGAALDAQLGQLLVAGDQTVTLTSQRGRVQVVFVSNLSYPVVGTLTLTSDKLLFPNGETQAVTIIPSHTTVSEVNVSTRASGLFKVDITVRSPAGDLVLTSGQVTVRSTATSVVGILLSAGAVVVLVVWWLRTSRRRRATRRLDEAGVVGIPPEPP